MVAVHADFEAWVAAHEAALLRFGYLLTGNAQAAEEAVQAALTTAYVNWERISEADHPDRYVRRMIANAHISRWRRWDQRVTPVAEVRRAEAPDLAGTVAERDAIWHVCRALPPRQRAVVVLRFYEDLDHAEIAALLGIGESSVRSALHRALASMRTALSQEDAT